MQARYGWTWAGVFAVVFFFCGERCHAQAEPGDCGNGICEPGSGEDACNCADDCFDQSTCGDGCCDIAILGEDSCTCPTDCSASCGDGCCNLGEDACICADDCFDQSTCGDGCCDVDILGEDSCSCPTDCSGSCGDGCCSLFALETSCNCPADCSPSCGNGCCDPGENPCNCSADCLESPCGDGCCEIGFLQENSCNCPSDCSPVCGDQCCNPGENPCNCSVDCFQSPCGDGCCEIGFSQENSCNCPSDCSPSCGNGCCDPGENPCNCSEDCFTQSTCGDGCCDLFALETCGTCAADCGCAECYTCTAGSCTSACGNGVCDPACEDCSNCPSDCGCISGSICFIASCDPNDANASPNGCVFAPNPVCGACCFTGGDCTFSTDLDCLHDGGTFLGDGTTCTPGICNQRLSTVEKGSLLIFSKVELKWDASGKLTQDTILTLVNDFTKDVHVKLYFENGDAPTEAVYADDLQTILVERAHNGWNEVNCNIELTENESTYLVMSTGVGGCQRFTILDPGAPPGRPNLEPDGGRVLRGVVYAWAVDEDQNEISHNHLSGHADLVHYGLRSAWEYQAYAFQATNPSTGTWTDSHPGQINLDGLEYDYAFNTLLFDFFAVGSTALSNGGVTVMLDTDLTLHPVSQDFRQDSCGPVVTKAHFDIWNANEDFRSGTARCITCWDQTLLSAYSVDNGLDNNFILADLGTDKGKARIDGMQSFECDNLFVPPNLDDAILQWLLLHDRTCGKPGTVAGNNHIDCCLYTINDSQDTALLGVAAKVLSFSGGAIGRTWAGMNLVGAGQESAQILFDVPAGPETATNGDGRRTNKNAGQRSSLGDIKGK